MESYKWMRPGVKAVFRPHPEDWKTVPDASAFLNGKVFTISSLPTKNFPNNLHNITAVYVEEQTVIQEAFNVFVTKGGATIEAVGVINCECLHPLEEDKQESKKKRSANIPDWNALATEFGVDPKCIEEDQEVTA